MAGKRFKIYQDMYENLYIEDKETGVGIGVGNEEDVRYNTVSEIVQLLNELHEENKELLQFKYKVYRVINERIGLLESDYNKAVKAGMPSNSVYGEIELLEELKKELEE